MKIHTQNYKNNIKNYGRRLDSKITYTINEVETELGKNQLNSVTPHFEGDILKSTMKQIDIDANIEIPLGTILNYQFGVKVDGTYEYINYGNYIVYKVEKQEDTNSYMMTCYDKMLYSMKDYEDLGITYPISVKDYIQALCDKLGLTFANYTDFFANYDKQITKELYLDEQGYSLDYTYRDVLDQLAQVTASTICINNNDELELRYVKDIGEITNVSGTNIIINNNKRIKINDYKLKGNTIQQTYTGKNLFNVATIVNKGITAQGATWDTTAWRLSDYISVLPSTSYNISWVSSSNYFQVNIVYYDSNKTYISGETITGYFQTKSITTPANTQYIRFAYSVLVSDVAVTRDNIQLEKGSTATSYEQYVGGTASPNPDYPQDIEVVTGRQEIDIVGKNLFNSSAISNTICQIANDGTITMSGNTSSNGYCTTNKKLSELCPTLLVGETYYMYATNTDNKNYIYSSNVGYWTNGTSKTITQAMLNDTIIIYGGYNTTTTMQVMVSKTLSTTYEPYTGNTYNIDLPVENLFDKNNAVILNAYVGTPNIGASDKAKTTYLACKPNTTYTISKTNVGNTVRFKVGTTTNTPAVNVPTLQYINNDTAKSITITTNANANYLAINFYHTDETQITQQEVLDTIQVEYGSKANRYTPYGTTPIELCKIEDYQDKIAKTTGKNLFDKDNVNILEAYFNASTTTITSNTSNRTIYIPCKPNTTYTMRKIKSSTFFFGYTNELPANGVQVYGISNTTTDIDANNYYITLTTGANAKYLVSRMYHTGNDTIYTLEQVLASIQIEARSNATEYEPYGKNKLYIEKKIGKVVLNGTQEISLQSINAYNIANFLIYFENDYYNSATYLQMLTDNFTKQTTGIANTQTEGFLPSLNSSNHKLGLYIRVSSSRANTTTTMNTWLSNHNTTLYYVLEMPTYTLIDNEELINQLNRPQLLLGLNNINVSASLPTPLSLSYYSSIETIDEEQLKDINVKTSEKYGPINSIVLSRSAESDNVYLRDEYSVEANGLCELKIIDNQIMNWQDRSDYLPDILEQLNGLEYYTNDYSSTGITYLELCDGYDLKIGDNVYKCIMFNDEVDITQGLEEQVHTDMPNTSETDYKKADKTDRRINQAYIIVDKQQNEITAQANRINIIATHIDETTGDVREVTTTTGFTFNADGLNIYKNDTTFNTQINNIGTYYKDGDTILSQTTKDGTKTKDLDVFGYYRYGEDDITDDPLFIAVKYTDTNNEEGYGHFYNG